jgi:molybdopterin molybdotransferase
MPHSNIAGLDGYAVRSSDTQAAAERRVRLKIIGTSSFHETCDGCLILDTAVKINTGAVMPEGSDAVAAAESVVLFDDEIELSAAVGPGEGMRKQAEEFRVGEAVAERGSMLTPGRVGLLIAAGWSEVKVIRMPRVRVIAAGDELKYPGQMISGGQIYPSASAGIVAWLKRIGVSDMRLTLTADDSLDILEALPEAEVSDMVITLGGTGQSEYDVMFESLTKAGLEFQFLGVSARPGTYTSFGLLDGMPVICLPGGPGAAEMMFQLLVRRATMALMGMGALDLPVQTARLTKPIKGSPDLERLVRVRLEDRGDGLIAEPFFTSSLHREIAGSDGVVRLDMGQSLAAGDKARVWVTK